MSEGVLEVANPIAEDGYLFVKLLGGCEHKTGIREGEGDETRVMETHRLP